MNTPENDLANFACFDYKSQKWIEGLAAVYLRREQVKEELELLTTKKEYAKFLGIQNVEMYCQNRVKELAGLDRLTQKN